MTCWALVAGRSAPAVPTHGEGARAQLAGTGESEGGAGLWQVGWLGRLRDAGKHVGSCLRLRVP